MGPELGIEQQEIGGEEVSNARRRIFSTELLARGETPADIHRAERDAIDRFVMRND